MAERCGPDPSDTYAPPLTLTPALPNQVAAIAEALPRWNLRKQKHLLEARGLLMAGLMDRPGRFRRGGVGIYRGEALVHMAPPASRVPALVADLLGWPEQTDWHPLLAWLPIEEVIRARQQGYDESLGQAEQHGELVPFAACLLAAIEHTLQEATRRHGISAVAGSEIGSEMGAKTPSQRDLELQERLSAQPRLSARPIPTVHNPRTQGASGECRPLPRSSGAPRPDRRDRPAAGAPLHPHQLRQPSGLRHPPSTTPLHPCLP